MLKRITKPIMACLLCFVMVMPIGLAGISLAKADVVIAVMYTVTFDSAGGSNVDPIPVTDGATITKPVNPTLAGNAFAGWVDENGNIFDFGTPITADITLKAAWTAVIPTTYTVTFYTAGGSSVGAPAVVTDGATVARPADPTRAGFAFTYWMDPHGSEFDFNTPITADIKLTARWVFTAEPPPATASPTARPSATSKPGVTATNAPEATTAADTSMFTDNNVSYLHGYGDGTIRPDGAMTRAEAAEALYNLLSNSALTQTQSTNNNFLDTESNAWYNTAVNTLANLSVLQGDDGGNFNPNGCITRAELATILVRMLNISGNGNGMPFTDVPSDYWAETSIMLAESYGLIQGYPDGTFNPEGKVTRAEFTAMVNRATGRGITSAEIPSDFAGFTDLPSNHWAYLDMAAASLSL